MMSSAWRVIDFIEKLNLECAIVVALCRRAPKSRPFLFGQVERKANLSFGIIGYGHGLMDGFGNTVSGIWAKSQNLQDGVVGSRRDARKDKMTTTVDCRAAYSTRRILGLQVDQHRCFRRQHAAGYFHLTLEYSSAELNIDADAGNVLVLR